MCGRQSCELRVVESEIGLKTEPGRELPLGLVLSEDALRVKWP